MRIQVRFLGQGNHKPMREIVLDCSAAALIPVPGDSVVDEEGHSHRVTERSFSFSERDGHRVDVLCD